MVRFLNELLQAYAADADYTDLRADNHGNPFLQAEVDRQAPFASRGASSCPFIDVDRSLLRRAGCAWTECSLQTEVR